MPLVVNCDTQIAPVGIEPRCFEVYGRGQVSRCQMDYATRKEDFDERRRFDDRPADDRQPGPARAVDVSARCADCWGSIAGTTESAGEWRRIECLVCSRSVDGEDAAREADAMRREADDNMAAARVGRPANYRAHARFVLKLLPDMDRDKAKIDQRIESSLEEGRKRRRLTRHEIPPGTAGYLYAQARAFLAGVENLSDEQAAAALADLDYGEPRVVGVDGSAGDGTLHVTGSVPVVYRKPSGRELMGRMGTALVAGMAGAFACELGMKAILLTRLDGAAKTHDLLALYRELPEDSRRRLEGDFPEIARVLDHSRETFGRWRYFEQGIGEDAIRALVDTDRVWGLGKAARVIADECVVAGLNYEIDIDTTFEVEWKPGDTRTSQRIHLSLEGGEASVPWDEVLRAGTDDA